VMPIWMVSRIMSFITRPWAERLLMITHAASF
jgi:hypothetical protein